VLVKGGDYGIDEIHGREEVEAARGKVVSLPFVEGASTSVIIERMKRAVGRRQ
jgi:D-beta-D-heptose 7-phosphate kinase/D-beta-D-heptose 1-phosphate adenosyltransferase